MGCVLHIWLAKAQVYSSGTSSSFLVRGEESSKWEPEKKGVAVWEGKRQAFGYQNVFWRQGCIHNEMLVPYWWYTFFFFFFQEVGLVDYHSHHARDYSPHLGQPHRRRPSLLSEFQPGNERSVRADAAFKGLIKPWEFLALLVHLLSVRYDFQRYVCTYKMRPLLDVL